MTDAASATPAPRFVNPAALLKAVPLQFPVEYAGVVHNAIVLRRMTAGEVAAFVKSFAAVRDADPDATPRFPIFFDANGNVAPPALLDGLESDDFDALDAAAVDFLPRRFRPSPEAAMPVPASAPGPGEATAAASPA